MLAGPVKKGCGVASCPSYGSTLEFSWSMRVVIEKVELLSYSEFMLNFDNYSLVGGCYPWLYIDFLKEGLRKTGQINRPILTHRVRQGDDSPVLA